jgi:hypothetical protein
MIGSAMASLIARLRPARSFLKSVFSPGGGCHAHRRAGICIYDACVDKCVAVLGQAVPAEPPSLPEWALMWDDELLERIPSTSATNIEAGLCDRLRELRGSRREAGLARHLKLGYWTFSVPFITADVLRALLASSPLEGEVSGS